jgi:hypothetical protein
MTRTGHLFTPRGRAADDQGMDVEYQDRPRRQDVRTGMSARMPAKIKSFVSRMVAILPGLLNTDWESPQRHKGANDWLYLPRDRSRYSPSGEMRAVHQSAPLCILCLFGYSFRLLGSADQSAILIAASKRSRPGFPCARAARPPHRQNRGSVLICPGERFAVKSGPRPHPANHRASGLPDEVNDRRRRGEAESRPFA